MYYILKSSYLKWKIYLKTWCLSVYFEIQNNINYYEIAYKDVGPT